MGCSQSAGTFFNPQNIKLLKGDDLNQPIIDEEVEAQIYDLLEYWFCCDYLPTERTHHIKVS